MKRIWGVLTMLLCGSALVAQQVQQTPPAAPPQPPQGAYKIPGPPSPVVHNDGSITFNLFAPAASTVALDGDYPIGNGYRNGRSARPMTNDGKGVWTITVKPLKPEIYSYYFIVDAVPTLDPHNTRVGRDGDHYANWAVVPGPLSADYVVNNVPHGRLSQVWYPSPTLKLTRRMFVYTPPGYEKCTDRFPVFYLLHGGGGDEEAWIDLGRAPEIFDSLIAQGKMKPAIVAIFNGNANQAAANNQVMAAPGISSPEDTSVPPSADRLTSYRNYSDSIVRDLVPFIDANYRTKADANDRALAGLSAGGMMTLYTSVNHLDSFAWVGVFSGGLPTMPGLSIEIPKPADADRRRGPDAGRSVDIEKFNAAMPALGPAVNEHLKLLYLTLGDDDGLVEAYADMRKLFDEKGVKYDWFEIPGYGHEWSFWRINLVNFSQMIFQEKSK